jgi:sugar lactone lactonase YvrE
MHNLVMRSAGIHGTLSGPANLVVLGLALLGGCAEAHTTAGAVQVEAVALGRSLTHDGVVYPEQRLVLPVNDRPDPYERIHPWGELPTGPFDPGGYDGRASFIGLGEGPDGNLYALTRCLQNSCTGRSEPPLMKFAPDGRLLATWGEGLFDFPHGFSIDRQGNVWATDQRNHLVYKFSSEGELLMTLGERDQPGDPPTRLDEPTAVAVAPNGDIFITEGHSNSPTARVNRVSKFSSTGTFLKSWGRTGSGIGEFSSPHTIAFDSRGRVFVGDRNNNRIQIFDQEGNFLDLWYQFGRPSGIHITAEDRIYVADSESFDVHNPGWEKGIRIGSAVDGTVDYFIRDLEAMTVSHSGPEGVGVDSRGNVYGAVVRRRMLEKHVVRGSSSAAGQDVGSFTRHTRLDGSHLGHVVSSFEGAPDDRGLAVTAAREANVAMMHANFAAGDLSSLDAMQTHVRHVLFAIDPQSGSKGVSGLGYGLKTAAEGIARHLDMAVGATDSPEAMRLHGRDAANAARAVIRRGNEMTEIGQRVLEVEAPEAAAQLVEQLLALALQLDTGVDLDGNGRIDRNDEEPGLNELEAQLYMILERERLHRSLH